jgi:hypothetical protein
MGLPLVQSAGAAISGTRPTYILDFGTGLSLNTLYTASFSIQSGIVMVSSSTLSPETMV